MREPVLSKLRAMAADAIIKARTMIGGGGSPSVAYRRWLKEKGLRYGMTRS